MRLALNGQRRIYGRVMAGVSLPPQVQNLVAGWPMIRANLPLFVVILGLMGFAFATHRVNTWQGS
jgi:hypothetical protein